MVQQQQSSLSKSEPAPYLLSLIIPVYNEYHNIEQLLERLGRTNFPYPTELIIVDDGSTDGTRDILEMYRDRHTIIFHEYNRGKGAAIRTGIKVVSGTHVVIQDADLEYDPGDLVTMWEHMLTYELPVLYGSRSMLHGRNQNAGFAFYWGGQLVTQVTNVLYRQRLTDEPTCYKMFDVQLLRSLPLRCEGFEFCPEVTAQVAKRGYKIPEIPISYTPRSKAEGKKINWRDGVTAITTLVRCRLW
jgi:dolichol-phosphate mannosyltransferase